MKAIIIALLAIAVMSCNNNETNEATAPPTGNSDSVGATGDNPGTGELDTTLAKGYHADTVSHHTNKADTLAPQ